MTISTTFVMAFLVVLATTGCRAAMRAALPESLAPSPRDITFNLPAPRPGQLTWDETVGVAASTRSLRVEPTTLLLRVDDQIAFMEHIRVFALDSAGASLGELRFLAWEWKSKALRMLEDGDLLGKREGEGMIAITFPKQAWQDTRRRAPTVNLPVVVSDTGRTSPRIEIPATVPDTQPSSSVDMDTSAAWLAARRLILQRPREVPDSTRLVPDSATMYSRFTNCHRDAPVPYCELREPAPVTMLSVKAITADSVVVSVRRYQTFKASCPLGRPLGVPFIGVTSGEDFSMILRQGRWIATGWGRGFVC